jgi:hypothetical protein
MQRALGKDRRETYREEENDTPKGNGKGEKRQGM